MKHTYRYVDGRLYSEEWDNHVMVFLYNDMGVPIGMRYRTTEYAQFAWDTYWFERNLQGDITAIYNASGTKLVSYKYDAWGNHTPAYSNGGASIVPIVNNPLRYRGYYYDADLGLYYLQSRYYDSNTGRFINADGYISTGTGLIGYNMYAYCNNNPVMYVDYSGTSLIGIAILTAFSVAALVLLTSCSNNDVNDIKDVDHKIDYDNEKIYVNIDVHNIPDSNDFLIEYTNSLADEIESSEEGQQILQGRKIDRKQMYSEIKFHAVSWDQHFMRESANPAEIDIYADGSVVDHRSWLNDFVLEMYGEEYD